MCVFFLTLPLELTLMLLFCCCFFCLLQGHPAGKSERSTLSLAAQFLLRQQPLFISGLFLHCVVVHYLVFTATPPHPSACSPALHPLLCPLVGRGPRLAYTPDKPLSFGERNAWTACKTFQS